MTALADIPRAAPAQDTLILGLAARQELDRTLLADIALGEIPGDEVPNQTIRAMAAELELLRAAQRCDRASSRALAKIDAITRAFTQCFRITGDRDRAFQIDTVLDAVQAQLAENGWSILTRKDMADVLYHMHQDPTRAVHLDERRGRPVLVGICGQGAAV